MQNRRLASAAVIVMAALLLSRLTGFLRSTAIPNILGTDIIRAAYYQSFTITDFMYNILLGGAISAALIPVLSSYLVRNEEEDGWKAVGTFINVVIVAMVVLCLLGMVFSPQIVSFIWRSSSNETKELTSTLTRILFPSVAFIMLAGLANGVLNSYQRFAAAALGPSIYNLLCVLSILLLGKKYGVKTVVIGVMCSAILYFVFQLSFVIKNLKYYKFKIHLKHSGYKKLLGLAIPSLTASSIMQINVVITTIFATKFGEASVAAYKWASDVWQMPYGIFAVAIGTAILPSLSEKLAINEKLTYKSILTKGINMVLIFAIPSAVAFVTLNSSIISGIYQWTNKVTVASITLSSNILLFFSVAIVFTSMAAILNRAFYANNDTKTPLFIGAGSIILTVLLNFIFYKYTNLMAVGLSLAYSIPSVLNVLVLLLILNKRKIGVDIRLLLKCFIQILTAALIMGVVLYFINRYSPIVNEAVFTLNYKFRALSYLLFEVFIGVIVYSLVILLFKIPEGIYIFDIISGKLKFYISKCLNIFIRKR